MGEGEDDVNRKQRGNADFHQRTLPTSQLYWLLRPATDAAIDRALASPLDRLKHKLTTAIQEADWFDELTEKMGQMTTSGGDDDVDDS